MTLKKFARTLRKRLDSRSAQTRIADELRHYDSGGRRPWSRGYLTFRDRFISEAIGNQPLLNAFATGSALPSQFGEFLDERVVEYPWLLSRVCDDERRLLDAGSAMNFEHLLDHPGFKGKDVTVFTLEPEANCFWTKRISYVFGDLRQMPWRDEWFDAVICVSTLEHVGMDNALYSPEDLYRESKSSDFIVAVSELRRVVKDGGRVFITVPYGRYTNFGWYQQFDRERIQRVIDSFGPRTLKESYFRYQMGGWQVSNSEECRDAEGFNIHDTKYFNAASPKDYAPDFAACSRAIAALELWK